MGRARAMLAALLVILAGCGATVETVGEPTRTISPAPVPTDTPAPTSRPRLAPGLAPSGIVEPLALSAAHRRYLRNRSETIRLTRTNRYENGSLRDRTVQVTEVGADRDRFYTTVTVSGPAARFFGPGGRGEFWSDGHRFLQRLVRNNESTVSLVPAAEYEPDLSRPLVPSPAGGQVFFLASLGTFHVTERAVTNGTARYRLESEGIVDREALAAAENVHDPRDVSIVMVIDAHGVMRSFGLRYTAECTGSTVRVVLTGEHRAIGSTWIARPPWYDRALNESRSD